MPEKTGDGTDGPRALLTVREREIVSGDADDVSDSYRYQTVSRVRRRIEEKLAADMRSMDAHQSLGDEVRGIVCNGENGGVGRMSNGDRGYAALDELEADRVYQRTYPGKREKLEYVLESLHDADELESGLDWKSELWAGCTVEEVLGGLLEAEDMLDDEQDFMAEENSE